MTTQDAVTELMTKAAIQYGFEIEDIRVLRYGDFQDFVDVDELVFFEGCGGSEEKDLGHLVERRQH